MKSAEELDWLRIGAHFSDLGMAALRDGLQTGMSERELGDLVERAYVSQGAHQRHPLHRHHVDERARSCACRGSFRPRGACRTATWWWPRSARRSGSIRGRCCAASRWASRRKLYRDLHAAADAAFDAIAAVLKAGATPAQVIEASGVIEDAGFTIIDDLLHGYGGGYLPPILGCKSRPAGPVPQEPFRAGQTVVIQPNVVTRDGKAGVQTGEMVVITETGIERLHAIPRGFVQLIV